MNNPTHTVDKTESTVSDGVLPHASSPPSNDMQSNVLENVSNDLPAGRVNGQNENPAGARSAIENEVKRRQLLLASIEQETSSTKWSTDYLRAATAEKGREIERMRTLPVDALYFDPTFLARRKEVLHEMEVSMYEAQAAVANARLEMSFFHSSINNLASSSANTERAPADQAGTINAQEGPLSSRNLSNAA